MRIENTWTLYGRAFLWGIESFALYRLVSVVEVQDIALCARGLEFDFRAGEIEHSVAHAAMFFQSFVAQGLSSGDGSRHSLSSWYYIIARLYTCLQN